MNLSKNLVVLVSILTLLFFSKCIPARGETLGESSPQVGAEYVGSEACADCHEDVVESFAESYHGMAFKNGEISCESCHGPGGKHVDSEDPADIINFSGKTNVDLMRYTSICFECHKRTEGVMAWSGSIHYQAGLSCTTCHKVHVSVSERIKRSASQPFKTSVETSLLKERDPELCYSCHGNMKARMNYPSHHPVGEGKMKCSDCHNPHGSVVGMLKTDERLNDLCYRCHPDKQGPYAFEHPPVVEDCTICHKPHGTVAHNLLKRTEPFLCLQCHHSHFQTFEHKDFQYVVSVRCTQCHVAVHGSNHPAQGAPMGGKALTR